MSTSKQCCSRSTLKGELEAIHRQLSLPETKSWEHAIVQMTHCCNNGGCEYPTEILAGVRSLSKQLIRAINSERNSLSDAAIALLAALSTGLGRSFAPLIPLFFPTLVGVCARTNKVFTNRARSCIIAVIRGTQSPSILLCLAESLNSKSSSVRLVAAEGILAYLNCVRPSAINHDTRASLLEGVIKLTALDASLDVRQIGEEIFRAYKALLPGRVESFIALLTPIVKKRLAVHSTVASQSTSQILPRSHPTTGNVRPIGSRKFTSSKPSEGQARPLSSECPRDVRAAQPVIRSDSARSSERRDAIRGKPSVGVRRVPAPLPETGASETPRTIQKTDPASVKLSSVGSCLMSKHDTENNPVHSVNAVVGPSVRADGFSRSTPRLALVNVQEATISNETDNTKRVKFAPPSAYHDEGAGAGTTIACSSPMVDHVAECRMLMQRIQTTFSVISTATRSRSQSPSSRTDGRVEALDMTRNISPETGLRVASGHSVVTTCSSAAVTVPNTPSLAYCHEAAPMSQVGRFTDAKRLLSGTTEVPHLIHTNKASRIELSYSSTSSGSKFKERVARKMAIKFGSSTEPRDPSPIRSVSTSSSIVINPVTPYNKSSSLTTSTPRSALKSAGVTLVSAMKDPNQERYRTRRFVSFSDGEWDGPIRGLDPQDKSDGDVATLVTSISKQDPVRGTFIPSARSKRIAAMMKNIDSRIGQSGSHGQPTMEDQLQTLSQASRVVASRSSRPSVGRKTPPLGGWPVTQDSKPAAKAVSLHSKLGARTNKPAASGEPLVYTTTPHSIHVSRDVSCPKVIDTTASASPCDVGIQDSGVKNLETRPTSIQGISLSKPSSHVSRDVSHPSAHPEPALRRPRHVSPCLEPPHSPRNCMPSLCDRSTTRTPPSHDVYIPQDLSRPSYVKASSQGERLWQGRCAKFPLFIDPITQTTDPEPTLAPSRRQNQFRSQPLSLSTKSQTE